MFNFEKWLEADPYSWPRSEKDPLFAGAMDDLTRYHADHCASYQKILRALGHRAASSPSIEAVPFLPARLFKEVDLTSSDPSQIIKTMTSSGTSGQSVSRIFLDAATSDRQRQALSRLVAHFIGKKRLPMLIIDSQEALAKRDKFSARAAGVKGFSLFGESLTFALNEDLSLNVERVKAFADKHHGAATLIFGFTFLVWDSFVNGLKPLPFSNATLIHGGGWKRLTDKAVSNARFKEQLREICGLTRVFNYYGMIEQSGSIFLECEKGHLHCSNYSDIIVRDSQLRICKKGERGLVEVLSVLPLSYPGHALLTEDEGEILGEDDCPCGRNGRYFTIYGRVAQAEVRGCSDAIAA
ncbi:MAG: acyl-protein synthetase [Deltaproteobacteria bacterium]|nr:acyl-protein synthetase [Deltaproteobacteria bacterium]MBI3295800.1 acyl-protein synthetase [Deltaproteobacteria bacterium]